MIPKDLVRLRVPDPSGSWKGHHGAGTGVRDVAGACCV